MVTKKLISVKKSVNQTVIKGRGKEFKTSGQQTQLMDTDPIFLVAS